MIHIVSAYRMVQLLMGEAQDVELHWWYLGQLWLLQHRLALAIHAVNREVYEA